MGSVVFSSTYSMSGYTTKTYNVRVSYSEDYNAATNKTTVRISGVELQIEGNSTNWGSLPFFGSVAVNGTTLLTMNGGASVRVSLSSSGYCSVAIPTSSAISISHNTDGTATFTLSLSGGFSYAGGSYFCAIYNSQPFGVKSQSKTASLTRRAYTLTVNPNGGVWDGNSSQRTFSQAPTTTKSISDPERTGYDFSGWVLSGGGSFSGAIYTFGTANGTLAASWEAKTYSVTYNANGGDGAPEPQTKTYGATLVLSDIIPTRVGFQFLGWSADSGASTATYQAGWNYTANETVVLYAIWQAISFVASETVSDRGITANLLRTASPNGGGSSGLLNNGDAVYYGDTVKVSWAISVGYQADVLEVNGEDVSSLAEKTVTVTDGLVVILTVELGAIVYVDGVAYQAFVDNGSEFSQCEAYIDNGSAWEAY